jgi:hypothetical protein
LLFGFRDLVAGRGFLAGVAVNGRALLVHDDDGGYWMHGVNPGGMAAGGADIGEAQGAFRETYRTILFDIAADAAGFEEFKTEVESFFNQTSAGFLPEWEEAVKEVRAGKIEADWLPRVDSDRAKLAVHVVPVSVEQLQPSMNEPDEEPALAAAVGF